MNWKQFSFVDWFLGVFAAIGFVVYGIVCIVRQQGVLIFPVHRLEMGSIGAGLPVSSEAAIYTGIAYQVWALFCHFAGIWRHHPNLHRETWGKVTMALFAAATVTTLVAMFAM